MTIQELIAALALNTHLIDALLDRLNKIAKDTYGSEGGLPLADDNAVGNMSFEVLSWLAMLDEKAVSVPSPDAPSQT